MGNSTKIWSESKKRFIAEDEIVEVEEYNIREMFRNEGVKETIKVELTDKYIRIDGTCDCNSYKEIGICNHTMGLSIKREIWDLLIGQIKKELKK